MVEDLHIEFSGSGEHDYLWVEKTGSNTDWVARRLAHYAGVRHVDVGYAGLKDRHAITRQWFSVRHKGCGADWTRFECDGVNILDTSRHSRKLQRGSHAGNQFRIALRTSDGHGGEETIDERLAVISSRGVPNYFGPQRFGHEGSNLELARRLFRGERLRRDRRSIAISSARSLLFNEVLAARVADGSWNRILPGELANLDGSNSVFDVSSPDETIERRCAALDIHPSGPLYGCNGKVSTGEVAAIEKRIVDRYPDLAEGLIRARARRSQRSLRLRVGELDWEFGDGVLWLEFRLRKGGFATAVLEEVACIQDSRNST